MVARATVATVSSLQASAETVSAARSRIQDADFAQETANMTRAQILQQAALNEKFATFIQKNADSLWKTAMDPTTNQLVRLGTALLADREMRRSKEPDLMLWLQSCG